MSFQTISSINYDESRRSNATETCNSHKLSFHQAKVLRKK
jgi:hypothetical protein